MSKIKTKEELLLDYKKSNKIRRAATIKKAGFLDESEYLAYLMEPDSTAGSPQAAALFKHNQPALVKPTIHNVHILDVSGSMSGGKIAGAIQGINEEVKELQNDKSPVIYTHSLIEFSNHDDIISVCHRIPIADVKPYSTSTRGMTALNQALGETLEKFRKEIPKGEKVLVKVFTDGGENHSRGKWADRKALKEFIEECENNDFTITFIGTQHDVNTVITTLNVAATNTLSHDNTASGIYAASQTRGIATMAYAKKVLEKKDVSKGFYKDLKSNK